MAIDPESIRMAELEHMHRLGVRGVRVNLHTTSMEPDYESFVRTLRNHADAIRPLGWAIQLFVSLRQIALIADFLSTLGVPIVIDHMGMPTIERPPREQKGYSQLMGLLERKKIYVKLSGLYRISELPEIDQYIMDVLRMAPSQVVWASDWPHSGGVARNPGGDRDELQEYRIVDIPKFVLKCKSLCGGDAALIKKIWVDNPRMLWQYNDDD